mmetsp:Transcript_8821/g.22635  ORF Transcript_8821/g.22635 Transcript_8821/m.22635 type:complete len:1198 (+) Transcript_8821:279-3872(+)
MSDTRMYDASPLWWPAFGPLYDDLSHPMKTSIEDVGRALQANREKLLLVLSFFRPPQEATTAIITMRSQFHFDQVSNVKCSELQDPELRDLVLQASTQLNLDAIQAFFLILHYKSSLASKASTGGAEGKFVSLEDLQVFYFQERLYMLKCLELMIQDGGRLQVAIIYIVDAFHPCLPCGVVNCCSFNSGDLQSEASPFWSVTTSMLFEDLDARVVDNITANITDSYGSGAVDESAHKGKQAQSSSIGVSKHQEHGVGQRDTAVWQVEATRELCNLLDILLAIWDNRTLLCPCYLWLKLADSFHNFLFRCEVKQSEELDRTIPRAKDLASLVLVQGLHLEDVLQQMYCADMSLEQDALFSTREPQDDGDCPSLTTKSSGRRMRRSPLPDAGEGCGDSDSPAQTLDTSDDLAFSKEERNEITALLESWCGEASVDLLEVPTLLAWSAFLCLHGTVSLDIHSNPLQTWAFVEMFAGKAWENGGFAAVLHLAKADGLRVDYNLASVYKNIQINLVIASLATFGISPLTLSPDDLDVMLQTTYHLFNDQPDLCSMFWDVNALAKEPMFHFLNVARDIFPAVPMPLLYMLAGVCNGPQNATQVHTYLARLPSLTFRHYASDPDIEFDGTAPGAHVLSTASKPIKEIQMLSIPQGTSGNIVDRVSEHLPAGEMHATKLLRKLTSTPTPKSVKRTVSLAGLARGNSSPLNASRRLDGAAASAGLEGIRLEFNDPKERCSPRGVNSENTPSHLSRETTNPSNRNGASASPFEPMAGRLEKPAETSTSKPARTLSILTDVDDELYDDTALLIKWHVEPPRGSGMVKVLLEVGSMTANLKRGLHTDAIIGNLKVVLRLLSNMAQADNSTGKELLKYEVWDIESSLTSKSSMDKTGDPSSKGRVTLLSLICRLLDTLLHLPQPPLDAMGLCLSICAALSTHAPGEVMAQLMVTGLFETNRNVPLFVDRDTLETPKGIQARMEDSIRKGLPRFQLLHKEHECRLHTYPVTEGLLEVLAGCLYKGVTTGMVAEAAGWVLVHTLGKHRDWKFNTLAQKHHLAELCLRTIRRGLQCVTSAARHARSNEEVDHRIAFVTALENLISGPLLHIFPLAFPPPAVALEEGRVSSSNLVVIKSTENLAKEMLALVPALNQVLSARHFHPQMMISVNCFVASASVQESNFRCPARVKRYWNTFSLAPIRFRGRHVCPHI